LSPLLSLHINVKYCVFCGSQIIINMSNRNSQDSENKTGANNLVVLDYPTLENLMNHTFEKMLQGMNDVMNLKPIKESLDGIDLIDMEETLSILKVSKMTIHNWKKKGIIKSHKMGRKLYFKKSELMEAVKRQKYSI
jgi:excisionase family DNA binding protein